MPGNRYSQWLAVALRIALCLAALRHCLLLIRIGWASARVLRRFAPGKGRGGFRADVWLPLRSYTRLFRPVAMSPTPNPEEREGIVVLHRRLGKVFGGHQPRFDPLTGGRARRVQAGMMRYQFRRLFGLYLRPDEAFLLAGYGSTGLAILDFLDHSIRFDGSIPLALSFQLFLQRVETRHAKVSARRGILLTLRALAGLDHARPIRFVRAVWYVAQQLLCRADWDRTERRERRLHISAVRSARIRESAGAMRLLRGVAFSEQTSLLAVLADEMLWRAMDELLELRAAMPRTPAVTQRFDAASAELENNLKTLLHYQTPKEKEEDDREVA